MTESLHRLRAAVYSMPWAIENDKLLAIVEVLERRAVGERLSESEIAAYRGNAETALLAFCAADGDGSMMASDGRQATSGSLIAVLNVRGILAQHANQVNNISGPGGTSTEMLQQAFRAAIRDPQISAIVLNVDSPGGSVYGVQAMADEIYKARGAKPIVAQVNSHMASAAYWIGSAADEIVVAPGGTVGSIGVYGVHVDESAKNAAAGIKYTVIKAGKYKADTMQFEPLSEESASAMQAMVSDYYSDFVAAVAKHRGVSTEDVRNGYGQGRVEKDKTAIKSGLADRIGTLDDTLRKLSVKAKTSSARATARGTLAKMDASGIASLSVAVTAGGTFIDGVPPDQFSASIDSFSETRDWTFATADGQAIAYEAVGFDETSDRVVMAKINQEPEAPRDPPAASSMTAQEGEVFRRRRHALRMRMMRA